MIRYMLFKRTRAGILQLTLGIAFIMTLICSAIIFLGYYTKIGIVSQIISNNLRTNAHSGIAYAMAIHDDIDYGKQYPVRFLCDEIDSVIVSCRPWGIFDRITARARHGERQYSISALISHSSSAITAGAVYLASTNSPTYMVGNATIDGDAFVSEAGFSTGVIDGLGFKGNRFVNGAIKRSGVIPLLDTNAIWLVKNVPDSYSTMKSENADRHVHYSFLEQPVFYHSPDSIYLSDTLSGNIIIQSDLKIIVTKPASLKDVILIARDIEINSGFQGNIQCFAYRSITIHKKAILDYPSALVLMGHEQDSVISIRDSAQVHGVAIIAGDDQTVGSPGYFKIHKKGFFHGVAYVNGAAEIEGRLAGHITLRAFQQHEGEAVYGNYFKNGKISSVNRSEFMPASSLWEKGSKLQIAKWLE